MSMYDVYPNELIEAVSDKLKNNEAINPPKWAKFAKTGAHKERTPENKDWWYVRTAAILRTVCVLGPIGVSKLRTKYGGKRRRGHKKAEFRKGSGSVIRKGLQQLEKAKLVKFEEKGVHKGRVVTPAGRSLLDKTAVEILKKKDNKSKKKNTKKQDKSKKSDKDGKTQTSSKKEKTSKKE